MNDDFYQRIFGKKQNDKTEHDYRAPFGADRGDDSYKQPSGAGGEDISEARRSFSRIGLALSAFSLVAYGVILITYLVLPYILGESALSVMKSIYFTWGINVASMYLIAFPILFLILKNMRCVRRPRSKLYLNELF